MNTSAPLTSAELSALWSTYIEATMSICVSRYFINICDCEKTKNILQLDFDRKSNTTIKKIESILAKETLPIPKGFSDLDVHEGTPRLFSDNFILEYALYSSRLGSANSISFLSLMTRKDIRDFYTEGTNHALSIFNQASDLLLEKGIYIRPPYVETQKEVEFIQSNDYLGGLPLLTRKRPLNTVEISHLFMNTQTNTLGVMLCTGFSQVAEDDKVKKHMLKGKDLSNKIIKEMNQILMESEIPTPTTWDALVTDSTTAPFSDKLMIQIITTLSGFGMGIMGNSLATSLRSDIQATYMNLMKDVGLFARAGAELMIEKNWLEKPPTAPDREELAAT